MLLGEIFHIDKNGSYFIKSKCHVTFCLTTFFLPLYILLTFTSWKNVCILWFYSKHFAFVWTSSRSRLGFRKEAFVLLTLFSISFLFFYFYVEDTWTKFQIFVLKFFYVSVRSGKVHTWTLAARHRRRTGGSLHGQGHWYFGH